MVAAFKWEAVCSRDDLLGELPDWHCLCGCVLSVLLLQDLTLAVIKCMPLKGRNLCHASAVATLQLCVGEFLFYVVVTSEYFCDWHNTAKLGFYVSWICVFLDCMHFLSFCQNNIKFCLHACIFEPLACFLSYVFILSLNWSVDAVFVLCRSDTLCKGSGSAMLSVTESSNLEFSIPQFWGSRKHKNCCEFKCECVVREWLGRPLLVTARLEVNRKYICVAVCIAV